VIVLRWGHALWAGRRSDGGIVDPAGTHATDRFRWADSTIGATPRLSRPVSILTRAIATRG